MKKHFLNLILAWLFCQPLNAWTQAVTAELGFTPATSGDQLSPYLSHWTSGAQDIYITLTNADIQSVDVQLTIEVFFNEDKVLWAKRKAPLQLTFGTTRVDRATENINVGNILQGSLPTTYNGEYYTGVADPIQVSVSGMLPVGNWEFCVRVDEYASGNPLYEDCEDGIVSGIQPPQLVYPLGDTFTCNAAIRLEWMSHAPLFGTPSNAVVKVWEVLQGQDADLVILNNLPILQRTLSGTTQTYVLPTELYAAPGESHKYVWTVVPETPGATIQDNQAAAEPDSFWIDCPSPNPVTNPNDSPIGPAFATGGSVGLTFTPWVTTWITTYVLDWIYYNSECKTLDLGPDRDYVCSYPPIKIGDKTCTLNKYEWFSDPYGFRAFVPEVEVSPKRTTRYVVKMTTPAGTVVTDELWVTVKNHFEVRLDTGDVCGKISVLIEDYGECCNPTPRDTAMKINTVTYDSGGNVIGSGGSCLTCTQMVPPAKTPAPDSCCQCRPYTYSWSTGATTASIQANAQGPYSCTVSNGTSSQVSSIQFRPHCRGSFPPLKVTKYVRIGWPSKPFEIINAQGPAINAYRYRLTITDPAGNQEVLEGYSKSGFANGTIRWKGPKYNLANPQNFAHTVGLSGSQTWVVNPLGSAPPTTPGGTSTGQTTASATSTVATITGGTSIGQSMTSATSTVATTTGGVSSGPTTTGGILTVTATTGGTTTGSGAISWAQNGQGLTLGSTGVAVGNATYTTTNQNDGWSMYKWELLLYNCDYPGTESPGPYNIQYIDSKQSPTNIGAPQQVRSGTFFAK